MSIWEEIKNGWKLSRDPSNDVNALKEQIKNLVSENNALKRKIKDLEKSQLEGIANCDFAIDFDVVSVATIERVKEGSVEKTLIGIKQEDKPDLYQWIFMCSREKHNEIVQKYKEWMDRRNPKKEDEYGEPMQPVSSTKVSMRD